MSIYLQMEDITCPDLVDITSDYGSRETSASEDLLIHGDSIYDIVDKQDHPTLHVHLNDKEEPTSPSDSLPKSTKNKKQIFLCRINVSRNARRQMRFGDQKVILVRGHFYSELPLCSRDEPVRK